MSAGLLLLPVFVNTWNQPRYGGELSSNIRRQANGFIPPISWAWWCVPEAKADRDNFADWTAWMADSEFLG